LLVTLLFQLKKHHWLVEGPDWKHIHAALDDYAKSIQKHADEIAGRVNLIGGIPLSNLRVMLQNGLEEQQITIEQFRERIQFTKKNNDFGTEVC